MKLSDYYDMSLPLTRSNFIKLMKEQNSKPDAFTSFCRRMNKEGGYGALR